MRRKIKKHVAFLAALCVGISLYGFSDVEAAENNDVNDVATSTVAEETAEIPEVVYNDSNVSISSALDRYIAYNSSSALDEILGTAISAENTEEEAKEDSEPQKQDKAVSGSYIDFSNKAIVSAGGQVNIRKSSDVYSDKVGIIANGGLVTVVEQGSEWSHIKSGNCDGYIKNEFLVFGNDAKTYAENNLQKVAVVNATTLRLRQSDNENSECLTLLTGGEEYGIVNQGDAWTKVEADDSLTGYVKNEYISISYRTSKAVAVNSDENKTTEATTNNTQATQNQTAQATQNQTTQAPATEAPATEAPATEAPAEVSQPAPAVNPNAQSVCDFALQFVGNPYVYGGSSLTDGTDCSGFTMSVYANFGVYLPHSSRVQANCGTEVSLSEVAPGDIIFYKNGGTTIGHAALYIGGGQVVHACNEKVGIIVSNMYYSTPCKAIRVY